MINMKYVRLLRSLKHKHGELNGEAIERTFRRLLSLKNPAIDLAQLPYNPNWPDWFAHEAEKLTANTVSLSPAMIEHIGSTSIGGMSSKGIIDMAMLCKSEANSEEVKQLLATMDYQFYGVSPINAQCYWYWRVETDRCFVVHLAEIKNTCFEQPLLFRDYLRANPSQCEQYQSFKQQALALDEDLFSYSVRKLDIYCDLLNQAKQWQQAQMLSQQEDQLCL